MTPEEIAELRTRMDSLIGSKRWITAFAYGLEKARPVVNNWFVPSRYHPPSEFVAVLELLEALPVNKWPKRWNKLAEIKKSAAKSSK